MRIKYKKNNSAITDMIGTLMLLAITVGMFSVVYFFVFTIEVTDQPSSINIIGYVYDDKVYFEHCGGPSVNISEITIKLNIDGIEYNKNPYLDNDFSILIDNTKGDPDLLEIGEILTYYNNSNPNLLNNTFVSVRIIDSITNSHLMSGILQREVIS